MTRRADIERVYRNLALVSRRSRARSAATPADLSFVAHTLLAYIDSSDGCRATDLAALYGLDKSTISRQLTALQNKGYISRGERQGRDGQLLTVTPRGRMLLDAATRAQVATVATRMAGWPAADVRALADLLDRYTDNTDAAEQG